MDDLELWKLAQQKAKENYEHEYGTNSWEERADKYEREDCVWFEYKKLRGNKNE